MRTTRSAETQEIGGTLPNRPRLVEEFWAFMQRHINQVVPEKGVVTPDFRCHMRLRSAEGFTLINSSRSGAIRARLSRGRSQITKDGRNSFILVLPSCGESRFTQFGRSQSAAGSFAFVSQAEPLAVEFSNNVTVSLIIPRELIDHRLSVGERFCLRSYAGSESFKNLLIGTLTSLGQNVWGLTREEFLTSARAVTDLLLLMLEGSPDVLSGEHSVRMANLTRAKRIIRNRLGVPDLTPADIAREAGASLSYIQKLFRNQGQTLYAYLQSERLLLARELLRSSPRMTIADASRKCGFSDNSHFTKTFKQKFGMTPREAAARY